MRNAKIGKKVISPPSSEVIICKAQYSFFAEDLEIVPRYYWSVTQKSTFMYIILHAFAYKEYGLMKVGVSNLHIASWKLVSLTN